jgi:DNA-binding transcriptional LysR family regulator
MRLRDRVGGRLKLQDLQVLMAVAEAGSMRKAAALLNTTQPSVSRAIADLEATVGLPLLDRHPHGVEPTVYGRALLDGGVAMFDDLRQAVNNIEFLANPETGDVRIACGYHLAASFVCSVVENVSLRYPRIAFRITSLESTQLMHCELMERNVDLLIARKLQSETQELLDFDFLFDDHYHVVAGAAHPIARRRRVELADLVKERWVLPPPEVPPGNFANEAFRASGIDPPPVAVIATQPDVRMRLVATGRFLTIIPTSVIAMSSMRRDIKIVPVAPALSHVQIGVVTLKNRMLSPVTKLFIQHVRELAKPLARVRSR